MITRRQSAIARLDFVNTVGNRLRECRDYFTRPGDVARWARLMGLGRLRILGSELDEIRRRREYLYALFVPFARGKIYISSRPMADLNEDIAQLWPKRRLFYRNGKVGWVFCGSGAERLANDIVFDAAELLLTGDCKLVRQCQDTSCGWLYLDRSREKNRRWCSMRDCGNRAKARRHYALQHAGNDL